MKRNLQQEMAGYSAELAKQEQVRQQQHQGHREVEVECHAGGEGMKPSRHLPPGLPPDGTIGSVQPVCRRRCYLHWCHAAAMPACGSKCLRMCQDASLPSCLHASCLPA
jgi:hypothetical protein